MSELMEARYLAILDDDLDFRTIAETWINTFHSPNGIKWVAKAYAAVEDLLRLLEVTRFDVALLDVGEASRENCGTLPGLKALTERLKRDNTLVFLTSGIDIKTLTDTAIELGVQQVWKPVYFKAFMNTVENLIINTTNA